MNISFTPGPWRQEGEFVYGGNLRIADTSLCDGDEADDSELDANARLIAASPRMYDALVKMEKTFNAKKIDPMSAFVAIECARAAINQATGQEP